MLSLELLPVEGCLRTGFLDDGGRGQEPGGGLQQAAAADHFLVSS
jgi:hypothetical protein